MVFGCSNQNQFILDNDKNFSINTSCIKSLYVEEASIYAELFTRETFLLMKCKNTEEAKKELEGFVIYINKSNS